MPGGPAAAGLQAGAGSPPAPFDDCGIKDVLNTGTHEIGHFGGLGDIYIPGYIGWDIRMGSHGENLTMYGIIRDCETTKQSLEQGDINGLAYIYDNVPKSSLDLVLIFDATADVRLEIPCLRSLEERRHRTGEHAEGERPDRRGEAPRFRRRPAHRPSTPGTSAR